MTKAITTAKLAQATIGRLLSDAIGHHSDLRTALVRVEQEIGAVGTDPVSQAFATFRVAITPAAVRKVVNAGKGRGYDGLITAAVVRRSAADALRQVLESEIA
jgi:hypothetical protein